MWQWDIFRWFSNTVLLGVKKSPIWVSRDGPKHEGGPLKNLKGKALTEVPTIVFDCAYVGSSVEAPSPRWWGAKWHQRWHMTSLKLEFNIYRGANHHPIWNWILESIAFSIILEWLERVGCPCRIKYRSFLDFFGHLEPFWKQFGIFQTFWWYQIVNLECHACILYPKKNQVTLVSVCTAQFKVWLWCQY